jgi:hypothetical protein
MLRQKAAKPASLSLFNLVCGAYFASRRRRLLYSRLYNLRCWVFVQLAAVFVPRGHAGMDKGFASDSTLMAFLIIAGLMGAFHPVNFLAANEVYLDSYLGSRD